MTKKGFQNFSMEWLAKNRPEQAKEIFQNKRQTATQVALSQPKTGESAEKGEDSPKATKTAKYLITGLNGTYTINIKPLSVNEAWQGKRYKTKKYKKYEELLLEWLPEIEITAVPIKITYEFGFSNRASDIDNPLKNFQDILCKRYSFDDRDIFEINVKKKITKKGEEYCLFKIESLPL